MSDKPTWRQQRILDGKAHLTCGCTDRPKYYKCRTCPFFDGFVKGMLNWLANR